MSTFRDLYTGWRTALLILCYGLFLTLPVAWAETVVRVRLPHFYYLGWAWKMMAELGSRSALQPKGRLRRIAKGERDNV